MSDLTLPAGIEYIDAPLPGIKVDTPAASGTIFFNGAHVAEWTPAGQRPVLWLSKSSDFEVGKAIRGGVSLVWPWFGTGASGDQTPAHGFARLADWHLREARVSDSGTATLKFIPGDGWWDAVRAAGLPDDFQLEYNVSMGPTLMLQLVTIAGDSPLSFEEGLHTYFAVSDVRQVRVEGLDGAVYADRLTDGHTTQQGPVEFTGETDLVFDSVAATRIIDSGYNRTILIEKVRSAQTVVWNPWIDKARAMPDYGDEEWPQMVCVEAVNVREQAVTLDPRERHLMSQTISVE